ncbi:MAG: conjugal transfer protein TraX [Lachnospiraceae bacterium]|nr:conjugal transfer protein TraX [Lachnospiraceae bacterium]
MQLTAAATGKEKAAVRAKQQGLSGSTVKLIAIISMAIDHTAAAVLGRIMSSQGMFTDTMNWSTSQYQLYQAYSYMRYIGRLGFPIFCFLLVEGFMHTHSKAKYAMRLGLFALISEIPFDLAFNGKVLEFGYQNVFFTLLIGLLVMIGIDWITKQESIPKWLHIVISLVMIVAGMWLANFLKTDYSAIGIVCIMVLFLLRNHRTAQVLAGAVSFAWELTAPAAFVPIALYNGTRGIKLKYFFYIFYPAHLLILYLISCAMGLGSSVLPM